MLTFGYIRFYVKKVTPKKNKTENPPGYTSPLNIYVVWHPLFEQGAKVADFIYSNFSRDVETPLSRAIGIPVFYRSTCGKGSTVPIPIDLKKADFNVIIALVDDYFFNDDVWNEYVK